MEAAFDAAAADYDAWFTHSPTGRLQRERVHAFLKTYPLRQGSLNILELNCGTGEDAIWLAQNGHTVTATDVSEEMLRITQAKAEAAGVADKITVAPLNLSAPQLSANAASKGPFDLVFSNFGGLNCIDREQFKRLAPFLAANLKPNGKFISVIMSKHCLWENAYFLLKGNRKEAFRRNTYGSVNVVVKGQNVPTWYYNPSEIASFCSNEFRRRKDRAIGFFLPPSYLDPFFEQRPKFLNALNQLERTIGGFFSRYADHYLIELERT